MGRARPALALQPQLLQGLPRLSQESKAKKAIVNVSTRAAAVRASRCDAFACRMGSYIFNAKKSRIGKSKAAVRIKCPICRRKFMLSPSHLQQLLSPPQPPLARSAQLSAPGSARTESAGASFRPQSSSRAAAAAAGWKKWDLCWAKIVRACAFAGERIMVLEWSVLMLCVGCVCVYVVCWCVCNWRMPLLF